MKNPLTHILLIILMLTGNSSCGQNFELVKPNKENLRTAYQNDKNGNDIIYHYLIQSYKPTSEKINIQKLDYGEFQICAFEQTFENGIKFSTESCIEASGIRIGLELPKISEQKVKSWIEKIYDADLTEIQNEWYEGKNIYGPVGEEAGCYYELKSENNKWIVAVYCGC